MYKNIDTEADTIIIALCHCASQGREACFTTLVFLIHILDMWLLWYDRPKHNISPEACSPAFTALIQSPQQENLSRRQ